MLARTPYAVLFVALAWPSLAMRTWGASVAIVLVAVIITLAVHRIIAARRH